MVYHGLASHFFPPSISHSLKVRVIADPEDRIRLEMERKGISYQETLRQFEQINEQRRTWSYSLYGIDTSDPALYDLVIHIQKTSVLDAADIIVHAVNRDCFQTTPESLKAIRDLALAAEVKAALVEMDPTVEVIADDGCVRTHDQGTGVGQDHGRRAGKGGSIHSRRGSS
jgi:hypothetical protein